MEKVLAIGAMLWAATMVSSPAMAHEGLAAVRADILAWLRAIQSALHGFRTRGALRPRRFKTVATCRIAPVTRLDGSHPRVALDWTSFRVA